jgi:hypothetical protein
MPASDLQRAASRSHCAIRKPDPCNVSPRRELQRQASRRSTSGIASWYSWKSRIVSLDTPYT